MCRMVRSFLPVGQGAFYRERFEGILKNNQNVNVVYDCGSTNKALIKQQIENTFEKGETVHAVFLSHLHSDHINGLETLLTHCTVNAIFFPLLTSENRKYLTLYHMLNSANSHDFTVAFINDPYRAFDSLHLTHSPRLYQIIPANSPENNRFNGIDAQRIPSGRNVANIILESTYLPAYANDWLYVPFHYEQTARVAALRAELAKLPAVDWDDLAGSLTTSRLADIKHAYATALGGSKHFNANSMTLYSGTTNPKIRKWSYDTARCYFCYPEPPCFVKNAPGCLYTGDYDMSNKAAWDALQSCYQNFCIGRQPRNLWQDIGCMQVPHHGSKNNYTTELSKEAYCFILSAGRNNAYRHPHSYVLKDLLFNNRQVFLVSENSESAVHIYVQ